jgi:hypothetical protein
LHSVNYKKRINNYSSKCIGSTRGAGLAHPILSVVYSVLLQNKTSILGYSKNVIFGVIKTFETLWSDDEFKKIWEQIKIFTEENDI